VTVTSLKLRKYRASARTPPSPAEVDVHAAAEIPRERAGVRSVERRPVLKLDVGLSSAPIPAHGVKDASVRTGRVTTRRWFIAVSTWEERLVAAPKKSLVYDTSSSDANGTGRTVVLPRAPTLTLRSGAVQHVQAGGLGAKVVPTNGLDEVLRPGHSLPAAQTNAQRQRAESPTRDWCLGPS